MPRRRKQEYLPPYVSLEEAIRLMHGVVSRSAFFARYRHSPEIIARLDIRRDPARRRSTTCNRQAVLAWVEEIRCRHDPAVGRDPNADNLRKYSEHRSKGRQSYGDSVAALCEALGEGLITKDQFVRAMADLDAAA